MKKLVEIKLKLKVNSQKAKYSKNKFNKPK